MKLNAALVAIAAGAVASAAPLRVIVLTSVPTSPSANDIPRPEPFINMRLGHAIPPPSNPDVARIAIAAPGTPDVPGNGFPHTMPMMPAHPPHFGGGHHRPCGAGRWRAKFNAKALDMANAFRKAFGLPLIDAAHPHPHMHPHNHVHHLANPHAKMIQVTPITPGNGGITTLSLDREGKWGMTKGGERVVVSSPHHHSTMDSVVMESNAERPFAERFTAALMSLGPWEGRAVAFVVGAGLGVLLRMMWVLAIVMYRGCSSGTPDYYEGVPAEDDDEEEEEVDGRRRTPVSAPPEYVYPVDEKIVYAQEVAKPAAPAAN